MLTVIKMKKEIKQSIQIPEKVEMEMDGNRIIVKGPLGETSKIFNFKAVKWNLDKDKLVIMNEKATKREKKLINTMASQVSSMIEGVTKGFEYKLQICSTHFPITVKVDKENGLFTIKNFLGENKDRSVKIGKNVDIKVDGDIVSVKSNNKELAGQIAASIESTSKVSGKDRRVFQDGIWIIKKEKGRLR